MSRSPTWSGRSFTFAPFIHKMHCYHFTTTFNCFKYSSATFSYYSNVFINSISINHYLFLLASYFNLWLIHLWMIHLTVYPLPSYLFKYFILNRKI